MKNNFKYRCARRSKPRRPAIVEPRMNGEQPLGAGSGGDPRDGGHAWYANEYYSIDAPGIEIFARSGQPRVTIGAVNEDGGTSGLAFVNVHADKAMHITTGTTTDTLKMAADGFDVVTELNQPIVLLRGSESSNPQQIEIGTDGFLIDANLANLVIQSMRSITLQVAGGTSSIKLTPMGITLTGPMININ